MFTNETLALALVIFAARVVDVSLGTIRHAMIVRGKRLIPFCIAFLESLVCGSQSAQRPDRTLYGIGFRPRLCNRDLCRHDHRGPFEDW